ncbi:hypothetical protein [Glycomyces sp. NRRL B-16210]|uniref:hypothetical protein n=1 Tax=Glycomyces sp. NRRL B-16210 TaxID=1463821 RepID=UPI0004C2565E|nr:hypothetical protein [Glycomyces sp. NRRL B-16210]
MTQQLTGDRAHDARRGRVGRFAVIAAFLWSLTAIPIGLWQLLDSEGGPFTHYLYEPLFTLPDRVPAAVAPASLIGAGVLGMLIARARPRLWPLTALYAVVFGMLMSTTTPMSLAGYLCAFLIPAVIVAGPTLLARGRTGRAVAAGATAALLIGLGVIGVIDYGAVGEFLATLGSALAEMRGYATVQIWMVLGGGIWAALTLHLLLLGRDGEPTPKWLTRESAAKWGRVASWTAFACALPYGLVRLTWLTPWTGVTGPVGDDFELSVRVWGLMLGFAALAGGVLCLGMTQRWGTRWPFWMPVVKGRPVPPMIAIIPASVMSVMFTFMAIPFIALAIRQDALEMIWSFPFFVWGPALGAATLAYAIRRGVVTPRAR